MLFFVQIFDTWYLFKDLNLKIILYKPYFASINWSYTYKIISLIFFIFLKHTEIVERYKLNVNYTSNKFYQANRLQVNNL